MDNINHYYLGCPIWANKDWCGALFTAKAKPKDYLRQYAQVFNTVEGSNTFYALPSGEQILRWRSDTPAHFRFSFKFPQIITHVFKLRHVQEELIRFFTVMQPLQERIGIYFLQLPPTFNFKSLPVLKKFLPLLPTGYTYAAEVRHPDFYNNPQAQDQLNQILQEQGINRAVFHTSTLHSLTATDVHTLEAQRKKPKMPDVLVATAQNPFVRFVGNALPQKNAEPLTLIAQTVVQWLQEGKTPYLFMHTPGDEFAPQTCRFFHQLLNPLAQQKGINIGNIAAFAGEKEQIKPQQMNLF